MDFEPPQSSLPGSPEEDPMNPDFTMEGTEPAWERKEELGMFKALLETIQQVLLRPGETFDRLFVGGGFVNPLVFAIITGTVVMIAGAIYQMLLGGVMAAALASVGAAGDAAAQMLAQSAGGVLGIVVTVIIGPIFIAIFCFAGAGIYHLMLMMLGGAKGDYETTFRVHSYAFGATTVLGLIPFCGGIIGWVWGLVCAIIGLSRAHQIETWKAAVAVLAPMFICCGLIVAFYVFVIAAAASAATASGGYTP